MIARNLILPKTVDNTYQGRKIAIWFFYVLTIVTIVRSLIHTFSYFHFGGYLNLLWAFFMP